MCFWLIVLPNLPSTEGRLGKVEKLGYRVGAYTCSSDMHATSAQSCFTTPPITHT